MMDFVLFYDRRWLVEGCQGNNMMLESRTTKALQLYMLFISVVSITLSSCLFVCLFVSISWLVPGWLPQWQLVIRSDSALRSVLCPYKDKLTLGLTLESEALIQSVALATL